MVAFYEDVLCGTPEICNGNKTFIEDLAQFFMQCLEQVILFLISYSTNHVYLHRPNAFGFWQMRLHLCYETLKRISNFSELA